MKKTYIQILDDIENLKKKAEAIRAREIEGVVTRMREAIAFYGLTPDDLGFGKRGRPPLKTGKQANKLGRRTTAKPVRTIKFRDDHGNVWSGRGPRPKWLRTALEAGRKLEEFLG